MTSGYMTIKGPGDLERALNKMLNKILTSDDPVLHAQKFASLANSWTNARRLRLDIDDIKKLKEDIARLEEAVNARNERR